MSVRERTATGCHHELGKGGEGAPPDLEGGGKRREKRFREGKASCEMGVGEALIKTRTG